MEEQTTQDTKRSERAGRELTRSRGDRYVGGVAAGIANYFNVDPVLVRIAFVVSLVIGGVGALAYLILLATVPIEGDPDEPAPPVSGRRRTVAIGGTILIGVLLLIASGSGGSGTSWLFGFGPGVLFGILLWIAVGAGLVWALRQTGVLGNLTGPGTGGPSSGAATVSEPEPVRTGFAPSPSQTAAVMPSEPTEDPAASHATSDEDETEVLDASGDDAPTEVGPSATTGRASTPSTFGKVMTWLAIAFTGFVLLSILAAISFGLTAIFGAIPAAAAVVLCGIGVVGLALADRPQFSLWLVGAALAIAIPMAVVSIASLDIEGGYGEINETPAMAAEIPDDGFKMAAGAMKVDLRDFPFRKGETLDLTTTSGFGATSVIVPNDVCVIGDVEGKAGYIDQRGTISSGFDPNRRFERSTGGNPVLKLDSDFKLGYFAVMDATSWRSDGNDWQRGNWEQPQDDAEEQAARERATAACATDSKPAGKANAPAEASS